MTFDEVQTAGKSGQEVLFNGNSGYKVVKYMQPGMIFVQPIAGGAPIKATAEQLSLA